MRVLRSTDPNAEHVRMLGPHRQLTPHNCQAFSLPDPRWTASFPALSSGCWTYSSCSPLAHEFLWSRVP